MARKHGGPWLRKSDLCWYTTLKGKLIRLGGPEDDPGTIQQQYDAVHSDTTITVAAIVKQFLDASRLQVAKTTFDWYGTFLNPFAKAEGTRPINDLTSTIVHTWINGKYKRASTRYAAARAIIRALNWSIEERLIDRSPLTGFRKATAERREFAPTVAQYIQCLRAAPRHLRDPLRYLWHSGARPREMREVESRHRMGGKVVLPMCDSKGHKVRRVIILSRKAARILTRLAAKHPTGTLFRNSKGRPWTKDSLVGAIERLRDTIDMPELVAYSFRHSWHTRMLEKGIDVATVAKLAGNSPEMVLKVYAHVTSDEARLRKLIE